MYADNYIFYQTEKKLPLGHFIQSIQSWSSSMDSVIFIAREKRLSSQISPQPAKTGNINRLFKLLKKQQEEVRRLRLLRAKKGLNTPHDPDRRGLQLMCTMSSQFETLAAKNKQLGECFFNCTIYNIPLTEDIIEISSHAYW